MPAEAMMPRAGTLVTLDDHRTHRYEALEILDDRVEWLSSTVRQHDQAWAALAGQLKVATRVADDLSHDLTVIDVALASDTESLDRATSQLAAMKKAVFGLGEGCSAKQVLNEEATRDLALRVESLEIRIASDVHLVARQESRVFAKQQAHGEHVERGHETTEKRMEVA